MKKSIKSNTIKLALTYIIFSLFAIVLMDSFSVIFAQDSPWIQKANMPTGRHSFTSSVEENRIYVIGGRYTGSLLTEYEPATDTWTSKTPMPSSRMNLASGVVNGKIYVIGGLRKAFNSALSTVEMYDSVTDTWMQKKSMPTKRLGLGVSVVNGKIYAIGGMTSGPEFWTGIRRTVEVYDPPTDTWSTKTDMPTARVWFSTSVVDGKIYAIGGALVTRAPLSIVEVYDPVTDAWTTKSPMPTARTAHTAAVVDGIIYVIGGGTVSGSTGGFSVVEVYNPATDTWTRKADIPDSRAALSASVVDGKIYAIGGIPSFADPHDSGENTVYEYDPLADITSINESPKRQTYPKQLKLHQNFPNPFNPTTTIQYSIPFQDFVTLKVYDLPGREIQTLVNGVVDPGTQSVNFYAGNFASGLYLYKLQVGNMVETRKMLLIR